MQLNACSSETNIKSPHKLSSTKHSDEEIIIGSSHVTSNQALLPPMLGPWIPWNYHLYRLWKAFYEVFYEVSYEAFFCHVSFAWAFWASLGDGGIPFLSHSLYLRQCLCLRMSLYQHIRT